MEKIIGLIDCNNFYASCERLFQPHLNNKPVVILSNNDGCIIARSNEAKALGIPMGEPYFKAKDVMIKNDVAVFSSNYTLYGDLSARVMATLARFVKDIEIYSIDEAFIDFTCYPEPEKLARLIKNEVIKCTGIPVCIGMGSSKTLAKTANRVAKKYNHYDGVFYIDSEERRIKVLKSTPVGDVWGVGRRINQKLNLRGINTAYDLSIQPDSWVRQSLTVCGLKTARELRGESCIEFDEIPNAKKSIVVSRSFGGKVFEQDAIFEALSNFSERASEKLRRGNQEACNMQVFVVHELKSGGGDSITIEFPYSTDLSCDIIKEAKKGLGRMYKEGVGYRKCGIMLMGLVEKNSLPRDLFDDRDLTKRDGLMQTIDSLNSRMGRGMLGMASSRGTSKWVAKKDRKSPCYTTRWDELPRV